MSLQKPGTQAGTPGTCLLLIFVYMKAGSGLRASSGIAWGNPIPVENCNSNLPADAKNEDLKLPHKVHETMAGSTNTCRDVLAPVRANNRPSLSHQPSNGSSQPQLNESAIFEHAGTYGEPVDPGLAALLAGIHSSEPLAATMAQAPKRSTATVANAIVSAAMASDDDASSDAYERFAASSESSSGSQEMFSKRQTGTAAERKARLMQVAEETSYDHPPSKDDVMQMQSKPLKVVLQNLRIKGVSCRLAVKGASYQVSYEVAFHIERAEVRSSVAGSLLVSPRNIVGEGLLYAMMTLVQVECNGMYFLLPACR